MNDYGKRPSFSREESGRTISDADVEAIASALEKRVVSRFYFNLGSGVWAIVWRGVIGIALLISAFGYFNGHK